MSGTTWECPLPTVVCSGLNDGGPPRAQTGRRGGAAPVLGLLGGKDLTGRLFSRRTAFKPTCDSISPIRAQQIAHGRRQGGPPGFAAHTRAQRADTAVSHADLHAARVR